MKETIFTEPQEKGRQEWKTFHAVRADRTKNSYWVNLPRIVHLAIRHDSPRYQQFFILKNAH